MITETLKRPLVSEKATDLAALRKYVFVVSRAATKNEVKKAVQARYGVHVTGVQIINERPKPRRFRAQRSVARRNKKAIVTLKVGEKIEIGV